MDPRFLGLMPENYLCSYCGELHEWDKPRELEYYDSERYQAELVCPKIGEGKYRVYFKNGYCYYTIEPICRMVNQAIKGRIPISSILESTDSPIVFWNVSVTTNDKVGSYECRGCRYRDENECVLCELGNAGDGHRMTIGLGFEFEQSNYNDFAKVKESKEDNQMAKTTFLEQLYEHSPKENVEMVKEWVKRYEPTLKWVIPVVSIYGAYRILNAKNSSLTVENIDSECNKKLGFRMDCLKDKKELRELMALGGLCAGAYATTRAISAISGKKVGEMSIEDMEEGFDELECARKKFGFIQSKTEKLLPVAVSVIIVYLMTQKPAWFESLKEKISKIAGSFLPRISVYWDLAKLFVADKLHVNLEDDEEVQKFKKFACLAAIVGVGVFLYGKKILEKKAAEDGEHQKLTTLMNQIMSIMEKLMPTAFAGFSTFLITKKILQTTVSVNDEEFEDFSDEEVEDSSLT